MVRAGGKASVTAYVVTGEQLAARPPAAVGGCRDRHGARAGAAARPAGRTRTRSRPPADSTPARAPAQPTASAPPAPVPATAESPPADRGTSTPCPAVQLQTAGYLDVARSPVAREIDCLAAHRIIADPAPDTFAPVPP
jgi:hypothetical protein